MLTASKEDSHAFCTAREATHRSGELAHPSGSERERGTKKSSQKSMTLLLLDLSKRAVRNVYRSEALLPLPTANRREAFHCPWWRRWLLSSLLKKEKTKTPPRGAILLVHVLVGNGLVLSVSRQISIADIFFSPLFVSLNMCSVSGVGSISCISNTPPLSVQAKGQAGLPTMVPCGSSLQQIVAADKNSYLVVNCRTAHKNEASMTVATEIEPPNGGSVCNSMRRSVEVASIRLA